MSISNKVSIMRDFNELVNELQKNLKFCFQSDDGKIFWYGGTPELVKELYSYIAVFEGKENSND